ncbi:uncharacterized protein METZ01_LOCUS119899 [marine metagenome]|uniref:C1q domain-containing protein n=1 Tax=marine metagenome TaxID=408172 RepID=A0A381XQN2_9ZZZZ
MPLSRIKSKMEVSQLRLDSSAASTDVNERVLLDGTDASDTNDGYAVILEDATANAFDGGPFVLSQAPISVANPAFRVNLAANQNCSHSTYTKIAYTMVRSDVGGYFDNTTNYRYQPLIAGYYQFNAAQMDLSDIDVYDYELRFYMNGLQHSASRLRRTGVTNGDSYASVINVNDVIHMNGTTDYIEVYARAISEDGSGTVILYGHPSASENCYFSGALISRTS